MCGIGGYSLRVASDTPALECRRLLDALRPRGPDDEGVCLLSRRERVSVHYRADRTVPSLATTLPHIEDSTRWVRHDTALVATRYAIQDLSDRGHQPFASVDGLVVAVFNGEIYNHVELRDELTADGVRFRTSCDTEVLVEGYRVWGDRLWNRLNGFWAVALCDRRDGTLLFSRDRLGVAPLYYRTTPRGLFFASSIRPLLDVQPMSRTIDREAVTGFIETELKDFDESTCYADVRSFPPASVIRFAPDAYTRADAAARRFWRVPEQRWTPREIPLGEAVRQYRELFASAVELRLRADVGVAFELSGGLDSSSIVAMAAASGRDVTTYTLEVPDQNEEPIARSLASRYRLDYRVIRSPDVGLLAEAAPFARIVEEPFHAPNLHTHYALRRRIKQDGFSVVLSGSGGDEVLAGYEHDFWPAARAELRRTGRTLEALVTGARLKLGSRARATKTLQAMLTVDRPRARSAADAAGGAATEVRERNAAERLRASYPALPFHGQVLYHLTVGQLPYYLRSNDHFSMALPLEARLPFLDCRLVEFCLRLPVGYLFRAGWTKYILRKAMEPLLPRAITWRREKMGFPFPLRSFLRLQQEELAPYLATVEAAGLSALPMRTYARLLEEDPLRLWRICSTGLWLHVHERDSAALDAFGRVELIHG